MKEAKRAGLLSGLLSWTIAAALIPMLMPSDGGYYIPPGGLRVAVATVFLPITLGVMTIQNSPYAIFNETMISLVGVLLSTGVFLLGPLAGLKAASARQMNKGILAGAIACLIAGLSTGAIVVFLIIVGMN